MWGVRKIEGPFVSYEEGLKLAKKLNCEDYIEVGARTETGLDKCEVDLIYDKYVKKNYEDQVKKIMESMAKVEKKKQKKKKKFFFF